MELSQWLPEAHPRFLNVLPPAGGIGAGAASFFAAAVFLVAAAVVFAGAAFRVAGAFFATCLVTTVVLVVPALVVLLSLSRPSVFSAAALAGAGRLVCRLGAREDGFEDMALVCVTIGFTGLAGRAVVNAGFSGEVCLSGDRGRVREFAERGERTVGGALLDAVRVAFVFACAVAVLVRFFGFAKSCAYGSAGAFSLSSSAKCSLSLC